jgi:translocation and assembly module TamB
MMTDSPNSDRDSESQVAHQPVPESSQKPKKRRLWLWVGSLVFITVGSGVTYGWLFLQQQLVFMVESSLTDFLNRPVELGQLQALSLNGVRFGQTKILATPSDPAHVSLKALEIDIDPLQLLTHFQLHLDITAIEPDAYLEQGKEGNWLLTPFDSLGNRRIMLERLRLKKGEVALATRSPRGRLQSPVQISIDSGQAEFSDRHQQIQFTLAGQLAKGGQVKIGGVGERKTTAVNLVVAAQDVEAKAVGRLIKLPLQLQAGKVNGNLEVQLRQGQLAKLSGVASLENVSAKLPRLPQAFTQTNGQLRFQGTQVQFDRLTSHLGSIAADAQGAIDLHQGFDLRAQTEDFSLAQVSQLFKQVALPVPVTGKLKANLQLRGSFQSPRLSLDVVSTQPMRVDKVDLRSLKAKLDLRGSQLAVTQFQAIPTVGGQLRGQGQVTVPNPFLLQNAQTKASRPQPRFEFDVQAIDLPVTAIAPLYQITLPRSLGLVSAQARFSGDLSNLASLKVVGTGKTTWAGGQIAASHFQYAAGRWQGKVKTAGIQLARLDLPLPPALAQGQLNGSFNVSSNLPSWQLDRIRATGSAQMAIAGGTIQANRLSLDRGAWQTDLQLQDLRLGRALPNLPPQFGGQLTGTFNLAGKLDPKKPLSTLAHLQGTGHARLALAQGSLSAENIQLSEGNFKTVVTSDAVKLSYFSQHLQGNLDGSLLVTGKLNNLNPKSIEARGTLNFDRGIALIDRPLTTSLHWNGQRLNIEQASSEGVSAKGWVDLDLTHPLVATGAQRRMTALTATPNQSGFLANIKQFAFDVSAKGLKLQNLPLPMPSSFTKLDRSGEIEFEGAIAGTPQVPKIEGQVALEQFRLANVTFEPALTGRIQTSPRQEIALKLAGLRDRLEVTLNRERQPLAFAVKLQDMEVSGFQQEGQLHWQAQKIELGFLKGLAKDLNLPLPAVALSQPLAGELSGHFALNLKTLALTGREIAIAQPRLASLKGDRLTGNFQYYQGNLTLSDAQFQLGSSQYQLSGQLTQTSQGPQWEANLAIAQGQIQDVLEAAQIFELSDLSRGLASPSYGTAADLWQEAGARSQEPGGRSQESGVRSQEVEGTPNEKISPPGMKKGSFPYTPHPTPHTLFQVGSAGATVMEQLNRLSMVEAVLKQQRQKRQETRALPPLADLQGRFDGNLVVRASRPSGVQAVFDLRGQDWKWGDLSADRLQAKGNFQNNALSLERISLQAGESLVAFSGSLGGEKQVGQLQVANFPLDHLSSIVALPPTLDIGGKFNAQVTLGGYRSNPLIGGEWNISHARINQTAIQGTQGQFSYKNARLNFSANSFLTQGTEPLTVQGSFPYQLPFATIKPDSDKLALQLKLKNEGLAFLNLVTKGDLAWIGGKGDVQLNLSGAFDPERGKLSQLRMDGIALLQEGTLAARIIPEAPLTNVNGKILFNLDRIEVYNLTGNFSGGRVTVMGTLPLLQATPQPQPLAIAFDNLAFKLKGLYQGGVRGQLTLTGTALAPNLGGNIELFDGDILLEEALKHNDSGNSAPASAGFASSLEFVNLNLALGPNLHITQAPILNFSATGSLSLNGSFNQLRPEGTIRLNSGQVNLFATQLRLANTGDNVAQFFPNRGLDPYLQVRLVTSVNETSRNAGLVNPASSSEINEPFTANLDSLQTVRVQANVQGFASQLTNNVALTSTPARSQREIITLLGGSFVNTFGRGDSALGLANLAGSAVVGSVQGAIGQALGLSEFRIFPTPLLNEKDRIAATQIGVAAEAGVDLTHNFSFSVLKILNTDRPPQFSLRYRLNENMVIRGSSNFADDSRGAIEFEQRF